MDMSHLHASQQNLTNTGKTSTFKKLLERDSSVSIHMRNIQYHRVQMYKVANDLSREIMKEDLIFRKTNRLRLKTKKYFHSITI